MNHNIVDCPNLLYKSVLQESLIRLDNITVITANIIIPIFVEFLRYTGIANNCPRTIFSLVKNKAIYLTSINRLDNTNIWRCLVTINNS